MGKTEGIEGNRAKSRKGKERKGKERRGLGVNG
jgi:hypothetical protein